LKVFSLKLSDGIIRHPTSLYVINNFAASLAGNSE